MKLDIREEWLLKMADKEANGVTSVGGLLRAVHDTPETGKVLRARTTLVAGGSIVAPETDFTGEVQK